MILPSARTIRLAALMVLGSLAGALWPLAGWLFVSGLGALGLAVILEGRRLPRDAVSVRRRVPGQISLNEPEQIVDEVRSHCTYPIEVRVSQSSSGHVTAEPTLSAVVPLPPLGRTEFNLTATVSRRGESLLSRPMLRIGRPQGLAVRQFPCGEEAKLHVFPNLARLKRYEVLRQARALSAYGIHRSQYAGLGTEFDHLRTFGRDDDFRRIHWKATARRGYPIVQVVRAERGQSVMLAVDVSHWMGISAGELTRLDYAIDAALFLAHVALKAGDRVGLMLFASEVVHFLAPSSRPGQIRRMIESLYVTHPQPVHPSYRNFARHVLSQRLRRSLITVITEPPDLESSQELTSALAALRPRHVPLCVGLRDPVVERTAASIPEDMDELCRRLVSREVLEQRDQRLREQRRKGLKTLDVLPSELSISLVNRYLELKTQGEL